MVKVVKMSSRKRQCEKVGFLTFLLSCVESIKDLFPNLLNLYRK